MWRSVVAYAALAACGRLGFDAHDVDASGGPVDVPADTPPLPPQVCALHRLAIPAGLVPANAALAAGATGTTMTLMWADAATPSPPWGTRVDTTTFAATLPATQLALASTDRITSIRDFGSFVLYGDGAGASEHVYKVDNALSSPMLELTVSGALARDGIVRPNSTGSFATMFGTSSVNFTAIDPTGMTSAPQSYGVGAAVSVGELAGDDGPDHFHIGFRVDPNGAGSSACTMGSIYFATPTTFTVGTTVGLPGTCREVRVAASADSTDNLFGFWQLDTGELDIQWLSVTGMLSPVYRATTSGRAPRTRYDGTVYRLAWIDSSASDELYLGEYPPGGTLTSTPLPGWTTAGDNAFTLVRQGNLVWLVLLTPTELDVLQLCN
jgi:hypothetical protein